MHNKRGSKGNEIEFTSLQMSEYLLPYNAMMNIEEKREWFALRNRMTDIPNTSLAAKGKLAHRLQRRTTCKIQNGRQWAQKWPTGSEKASTPRFGAFYATFAT